ncbi:translation initiation factor IF-2 [Cardinium endosymbiont of Oedothorax gibbosus]|uniref:translation initiation factor IF-2 n=1 Tax=Cardinium endosymbiont of Oedothorax gibbosus TaxID=931101 RepID=UPI002025069F|nr:translation initiation factor IF-2 [Cardinium endosymbiont of Oedothorax gibbosus]CAH2559694.1 Translation initiation factor IF-2 [Cardinium endosymbiont of Oedothorax gibbosus]
MNEEKNMRLSQVARKLNVGTETIASFLAQKGFVVDNKPNAKITVEQFNLLAAEFISAGVDKQEAAYVTIGKTYPSLSALASKHTRVKSKEQAKKKTETQAKIKSVVQEHTAPPTHYQASVPVLPGLKAIGKIDLAAEKVKAESQSVVTDTTALPPVPVIVESGTTAPLKQLEEATEQAPAKPDKITFLDQFKRPTIVGKMTLPESAFRRHRYSRGRVSQKLNGSMGTSKIGDTKPPARLKNPIGITIVPRSIGNKCNAPVTHFRKEKGPKIELGPKEQEGVSSQEIESQIKKTLAKLHQSAGDGARSRYKRDRRSAYLEAQEKRQYHEKVTEKVLKITEFISANELASFMDVTVNEVLSACMSLGMIISINQRLDREAITVVADEFGYSVEFVDLHDEEASKDIDQGGGELVERPPIVTIMGHVDHGKTSLLDCIRTTKVTAKEAGGITQHIGAYDIMTDQNKKIVFLDTPGHEAFTAMRTRGAQVTDIIVIVVAADDSIMPQTKESISHAQVAGCPIIIAINKIDTPRANPEKVKEDLAHLNILVEDWGGKYQCQEISAKTGQGVNELLEKILLEASLLELRATPSKKARGTLIESFLDPGRGYVSTGIVQDGTLHLGDIVLAGVYYGKVKAMLDHQNMARKTASPATPVQVLGLNGAPRAGDTFRVMDSIKEAGELAQKKQQLLREQALRTKSHLTLDEIGRRLTVGNFKELNIIIKGDMDGSIEALADALLRLSHEEVKVNILHKGVGAVSESDVLLAATAEAIIIAFHIKPSAQAKKLAEREGVVIKQYSIIYSAIDDLRSAVQGLLAPTIEEIPTGRSEIKKIFTFSKIGNIAGCQVQTGFIAQSNPIRVIRKEQVVFTGAIHTIKHGLEEIKQVKSVSECGIHIKNFDEIEVGDIIEGFERKEIKRQL